MEARILGKQAINFTNNSGEEVVGTNIFVAFKDASVDGLAVSKFFLKDISLPKNTKLNDMLEISFNHKGKIESITKA